MKNSNGILLYLVGIPLRSSIDDTELQAEWLALRDNVLFSQRLEQRCTGAMTVF